MHPIRVLLLIAVAAAPVLPAAAVPPVPAATTSFALQGTDSVQQVRLTALREDGGDVLLVQAQECREGSCLPMTSERIALAEGALVLEDERAQLTAAVSGRQVQVSWVVTPGSATVGDARVESDGASESTTAQGFAGRGASATVDLDGSGCVLGGGIGSAVQGQAGPAPITEAAQLVAGPLLCEDATG